MGALTFKNSAFESRPWELTKVEVPDYIDGGENLVFHLRGSSLLKITSRGWLRDRVRFSYDGYRRQRLTQPILFGRYCSWPEALTFWWSEVYNQKISLKIDFGQPYSFWLQLVLNRLSFSGGVKVYSVDSNVYSSIYQGGYGLESCKFSQLVLPVQIPYEELNVLPNKKTPGFQNFAVGLVQLFKPNLNYKLQEQTFLQQLRLRSPRVACFQVSPLQKFLVG